jgi:hypothetical protein
VGVFVVVRVLIPPPQAIAEVFGTAMDGSIGKTRSDGFHIRLVPLSVLPSRRVALGGFGALHWLEVEFPALCLGGRFILT